MALEGNHITSGILYAGSNFEEWATRVSAVLCIRGLSGYTFARAKAAEFGPCIRYVYCVQSESEAIGILSSPLFVSVDVLSRIPESAKQRAYCFWKLLESQTKSFRFLDLPAELRNRVYYEAFDSKLGAESYCIGQKPQLHPLTRVSKQVRQESIPIFWQTANVSLTAFPEGSEDYGEYVERVLNTWTEKVGRLHGKHLRYVDYVFNIAPSPGDTYHRSASISFSFSKSDGLRCDFEGHDRGETLKPQSLLRLQAHVARVERDRKIVNVQGESILLAMLSEPELWNEGGLEWED